MIGVYVHVKFAFFEPGLEEKREAKWRSFFAHTRSHIVYLAMSHMCTQAFGSTLTFSLGYCILQSHYCKSKNIRLFAYMLYYSLFRFLLAFLDFRLS